MGDVDGTGQACSYPVLLEAVLSTKEAILDTQLQAGRALQGAGVVGAVDAQALLLGGRLGSHGDSGLENAQK